MKTHSTTRVVLWKLIVQLELYYHALALLGNCKYYVDRTTLAIGVHGSSRVLQCFLQTKLSVLPNLKIVGPVSTRFFSKAYCMNIRCLFLDHHELTWPHIVLRELTSKPAIFFGFVAYSSWAKHLLKIFFSKILGKPSNVWCYNFTFQSNYAYR